MTGMQGTVSVRSLLRACALATLCALAGASPASAGGQTTGIYANQVGGSFRQPVSVASAPGYPNLLFVVQKAGVIRVLRGGETLERPFLDIRRRVSAQGEQGLLSIAFPANYRKTRRFYAYYTNTGCRRSTGGCDIEVAEFKRARGSATRADAASHRRVIRIRHRQAPNHNGGTAAFGPDGRLWLATGDGGGGGDTFDHARKRSSLLGKLLRIDPRRPKARRAKRGYRIPQDNPFVGTDGRDEIWSIGLRNPFRFSFDSGSDLIGIGDVGQDAWEEVNILTTEQAKGANFGWPRYEANEEVDPSRSGPGPLRFPVYSYSHSNPDVAAVTGGVFLRDPRFTGVFDVPPGLYVFGEFGESQLWRVESDGGDFQTLPNAPVSGAAGFGVDQQQRAYVASLIENRVYRLDPAP
jgi:glucose/arabinose dehydrogenase